MKQLKMLNLITRLILGGAQETALDSTVGLGKLGYDVILAGGPPLGPEGELISYAERRGVRPVIVPPLRREINPFMDAVAYRRLLRLFREHSPHIVHTHSSKAGILGRWAARAAGVPIVVHTIHGLPFHPSQSPLIRGFYVACERATAGRADSLVVVSRAAADGAMKAGIRPAEPFVTIESGFDVRAFAGPDPQKAASFRKEWGAGEGDIVIAKVARLSPLKGHGDLIEAFSRISRKNGRLKLVFIGNGPLAESLVRLCRERGIERSVVFQGIIEPQDIPHAFGAFDLLAHCSMREGLARVLPQAIVAGRPVVCYNTDGADEVIKDGRSGVLVPPGDLDRLTNGLLAVCEDVDGWKTMVGETGGDVMKRFSLERMIGSLDELYSRLADEKKL